MSSTILLTTYIPPQILAAAIPANRAIAGPNYTQDRKLIKKHGESSSALSMSSQAS
jgi:hypothetical protein